MQSLVCKPPHSCSGAFVNQIICCIPLNSPSVCRLVILFATNIINEESPVEFIYLDQIKVAVIVLPVWYRCAKNLNWMWRSAGFVTWDKIHRLFGMEVIKGSQVLNRGVLFPVLLWLLSWHCELYAHTYIQYIKVYIVQPTQSLFISEWDNDSLDRMWCMF